LFSGWEEKVEAAGATQNDLPKTKSTNPSLHTFEQSMLKSVVFVVALKITQAVKRSVEPGAEPPPEAGAAESEGTAATKDDTEEEVLATCML
jgi:hypothetical protein